MSLLKKTVLLMATFSAIMFLPFLGAYVSGKIGEGFFDYPPLTAKDKGENSQFAIIICSIFFVVIALVYLAPRLFGFKKAPERVLDVRKKVALPLWFWIGLVMWGTCILLLWGKFTNPLWLLHWSDLPLFWGMTFMVDGWVYVRNNGKSIISHAPQEMIGMGVASIFGWMIFEYLNLFVEDNWYYPFGNIISQNQFLLYATIGSSGLMPMAFEWYSLLKTYPRLGKRYANGLKVSLPRWLLLVAYVAAAGGMFAAGYFPIQFFGALWVSPLVMLAVVLIEIGVWTPLREIKQGNWAPVMLFSLTYLIQGITMEGWNYLSGNHKDGIVVFTEAPAYWVYSIPYADVWKVFEMPLLGYMGYIPFGLYCWIWWIAFAWMQGIPSQFYNDDFSQD